VPAGSAVDRMVVATRSMPTFLLSKAKPKDTPLSKRGLSPFSLAMNDAVQALKRAKGASLTTQERTDCIRDLRDRFNKMDADELQTQTDLYQEWRAGAKEQLAVEKKVYYPMWAGGNASTPVSAQELHRQWSVGGWPAWSRVHDSECMESSVESDTSIDFHAYSGTEVHGCGRWPRNIPRARVPNVRMHHFIECGVHNYLKSLGDEAVQGDIMLAIEGGTKLGARSRRMRRAFIVSGIIFSPCIFDVTCQHFVDPENITRESILPLAEVKIASRQCRISPLFKALDMATSDELILDLVNELENATLCRYTYTIKDDGTLLVSTVDSVENVGVVWNAAMQKPFMNEVRAPKSKEDVDMSDPLRPQMRPAPSLRSRRGHGVGGARHPAARGRGRGPGVSAAGAGDDPASAGAGDVDVGADLSELVCEDEDESMRVFGMRPEDCWDLPELVPPFGNADLGDDAAAEMFGASDDEEGGSQHYRVRRRGGSAQWCRERRERRRHGLVRGNVSGCRGRSWLKRRRRGRHERSPQGFGGPAPGAAGGASTAPVGSP
jgi:hypothetical protein